MTVVAATADLLVGETVGRLVGTFVTVKVAVGSFVGDSVGVEVGALVDVAMGVSDAVAVGAGFGVSVGNGVGVLVGRTATKASLPASVSVVPGLVVSESVPFGSIGSDSDEIEAGCPESASSALTNSSTGVSDSGVMMMVM